VQSNEYIGKKRIFERRKLEKLVNWTVYIEFIFFNKKNVEKVIIGLMLTLCKLIIKINSENLVFKVN